MFILLGLCKHHLSVTSQLSLATCPFLNSVLPPCFASFLRLLGFLCISLLSLSNAQRHSKGLPSCLHQQLFLMSSTEDNLLLAVSPLENWAGAVPPGTWCLSVLYHPCCPVLHYRFFPRLLFWFLLVLAWICAVAWCVLFSGPCSKCGGSVPSSIAVYWICHLWSTPQLVDIEVASGFVSNVVGTDFFVRCPRLVQRAA